MAAFAFTRNRTRGRIRARRHSVLLRRTPLALADLKAWWGDDAGWRALAAAKGGIRRAWR